MEGWLEMIERILKLMKNISPLQRIIRIVLLVIFICSLGGNYFQFIKINDMRRKQEGIDREVKSRLSSLKYNLEKENLDVPIDMEYYSAYMLRTYDLFIYSSYNQNDSIHQYLYNLVDYFAFTEGLSGKDVVKIIELIGYAVEPDGLNLNTDAFKELNDYLNKT